MNLCALLLKHWDPPVKIEVVIIIGKFISLFHVHCVKCYVHLVLVLSLFPITDG